ncbi:MAG: 1,4-dihydroxy-2-naphthoate polyprenyltransferase [Anaerolineales bacterium]
MSKVKLLLGPMRVPFLVLAPACVIVGLGTAIWSQGAVNAWHAVLAFIGGLCAHISVNAFNEYFDFKSGVDSRTVRTPFSGGSGTLQAHPELAPQALATAIATAAIVAVIGVYFLFVWGWAIVPLGLLGLFVVVAYTPMFTYNPVICLIAPGLGFGTLMVMGTDFVLTGRYSWTAFVASLVPFFLVNNLLLLNQFPDVEADRSVGRRHYPILIGRRKSSIIYNAFNAAAYLSIIAGVVLNLLPAWALLGLLTVPLAVQAGMGAYRYADDLPKLGPHLAQNVLINILTPVLLAIGLFIG